MRSAHTACSFPAVPSGCQPLVCFMVYFIALREIVSSPHCHGGLWPGLGMLCPPEVRGWVA